MANNYNQVLLRLNVSQMFSAILHYQARGKRHKLAFNVLVKYCSKGEHTLAEISEILIDELVETFNQLQHRSTSWTHITIRITSNYPNDSYRVNIPTVQGRLEGSYEERSAVRFEIQESGTSQTRWMNIFGVPKNLSIPVNDMTNELNLITNRIETLVLGQPIGKEELSLTVVPAQTGKRSGATPTLPLSCNYRGIHVFQSSSKESREKQNTYAQVNRR
jgi:hypothetical protein